MTVDWGSYEGNWRDDYRYGQGIEINNKGESFEGFWYDGNTADNITYTYNGKVQKGKIENGKFVAETNIKKEKYDNGTYEGEISNGKRNGFGTYWWDSGSRYEGNWIDDARTGYGKYFWASGTKYYGEFINGKMTGIGTYYFADGTTFEGQWLDNQKIKGKQTYKWGYYDGEWKNKTWCGRGIEVHTDGASYEGLWQDGNNATDVTYTDCNGNTQYGKIVNGTFEEI